MCLGYENTSQITLKVSKCNLSFLNSFFEKEMMHHSRAVARACKTPFLVGDMPFGSYEQSPDKALGTENTK